MKKILIVIALLGCALVYLQQQSLAEKMAQAEPSASQAQTAEPPAPAPAEAVPAPKAAEPAPAPAEAAPAPQAAEPAPAPAEAAPAPKAAEPAPAPVPASPAAEPARKAETKPAEPSAYGKQSHADYAKMEIKECNTCHKAEGVAPNHDADFMRGHRILASKAGNNCGQCHQQAYCLDCHQGGGDGSDPAKETFGRDYIPKSHRSDFINIHPIKALDNPQTCFRCHDRKYCNDCHSRFPMGSLRIKSHLMLGPNGQQYTATFGEHSAEARRNLQSCQSCHADGDVCIQCHSSGKVNPHPRSWKASRFKERTNEKVCLRCHLPGTY